MSAFDFLETYVHLRDDLAASPLEVGPDFWSTIESRRDLDEGRIVMAFHFDDDWPTWERHPAGDEIVCLLSGAIDLVLAEESGERTVELRGRSATVVPRNVWHTARVIEPSDALFITPGRGTENRPI